MRRWGRRCSTFPNRILNVHPSLLPAFLTRGTAPGLEHGARYPGDRSFQPPASTMTGVRQASVPVLDNDTVDTLAARSSSRNTESIRRRFRSASWRLRSTGGEWSERRRLSTMGPRPGGQLIRTARTVPIPRLTNIVV